MVEMNSLTMRYKKYLNLGTYLGNRKECLKFIITKSAPINSDFAPSMSFLFLGMILSISEYDLPIATDVE